MLGVFRAAPSACALAFGVPRFLASCAFHRGARTCLSCHSKIEPVPARRARSCQFQTRQAARSLRLWAAATEAAPPADDKAIEEEDVGDVEEFESELDAMVVEVEDDADARPGEPPSPRRLSLLESNVKILEQDCNVAQLLVDAATLRKDNLYLGLDISTQSTGYAVLQPSTATLTTTTIKNGEGHAYGDDTHPERPEWLRQVGGANLVEWGFISGNGVDGKKGDEVDVGAIVEDTLIKVAARCGRSSCSSDGCSGKAPSPSTSQISSSEPPAQVDTDDSSSMGVDEKGDDIAAAAAAGAAGVTGAEHQKPGAGQEGPRQVWVVGVEDFMRKFLPGRSNAKSIFALAQLNGIVKYACHKHLGAKAISFHPSTPRSFYGLTKNKPEGKDMKEIVHDFALSQENGALDSRYEWPRSPDGSKADASFDITDAYLIARYSWHWDVYRAVADDAAAKDRFAESFRSLHSKKLQAAEDKSVAMFVSGDMPAARGKKKLKPMTERSARNAHRKLQEARFTKAYEAALMEWFQQRVVGIRS